MTTTTETLTADEIKDLFAALFGREATENGGTTTAELYARCQSALRWSRATRTTT